MNAIWGGGFKYKLALTQNLDLSKASLSTKITPFPPRKKNAIILEVPITKQVTVHHIAHF